MWYWPPRLLDALANHPRANTSSKLEPKHYPEALARVGTEADDAGYVNNSQKELLSGQVLAEAGAVTCAIRLKKGARDQPSPVAT